MTPGPGRGRETGRRRGGRSRSAAPAAPARTRAARPRSTDTRATDPSIRRLRLLALALFLPLALLLFDPRLFTGGDNVVYYLLAKALAQGRGYVTLYEPGTPPHTFYPPGYPALLVPVMWLTGGSLLALKVVSLVAAVVAIVLTVPYLANRLPRVWGREAVLAGAVVLTATNDTFLAYSHWTLSEMPFLALSLGALILAERERQPAKVWLAAAALAAAGYLVRTAALPLCVAVVWAAWRAAGRRAGLGSAAVSLAAIGGWALRNAIVAPEAPGYVGQLLLADPYDPAVGLLTIKAFALRVFTNLAAYTTLEMPRLVWPFLPGFNARPPVAAAALGLVLSALALTGLVRQVRARGFRAGDVYAALYAGVLAVWPWNGDRFLLPILPLLLSYVLLGAVGLLERARSLPPLRSRTTLLRVVAVAAGTLLFLPNLVHAARAVPAQLRVTAQHARGNRLAGYDWYVRDYFTALVWIRDHVPRDAIVVSRKPQFTYYWSGRPSLIYPYLGPDPIEAAIVRAGADVLLLDRLGLSAELYLRPYLERYPNAYDIGYVVGDPPTAVLIRRPQ